MMKSRDSNLRIEQETIVRWDRTDDPVTICICYPPYWRKMEKAGFRASQVDYGRNGITRCKTFEIDRSQVSIGVSLSPPAGGRRDPIFGIRQGRRSQRQGSESRFKTRCSTTREETGVETPAKAASSCRAPGGGIAQTNAGADSGKEVC